MLDEPIVPDHAAGPFTLAAGVRQLARMQRRRGMRIVVSDFLSAGDSELDPNVEPDWERPMRQLGVLNQVLAVEVVDNREIEFPDVGDILIRAISREARSPVSVPETSIATTPTL